MEPLCRSSSDMPQNCYLGRLAEHATPSRAVKVLRTVKAAVVKSCVAAVHCDTTPLLLLPFPRKVSLAKPRQRAFAKHCCNSVAQRQLLLQLYSECRLPWTRCCCRCWLCGSCWRHRRRHRRWRGCSSHRGDYGDYRDR